MTEHPAAPERLHNQTHDVTQCKIRRWREEGKGEDRGKTQRMIIKIRGLVLSVEEERNGWGG